MSLPDIADAGDELATLREIRHILAQRIADTESARDTAPLVARMRDVLERIADLEGKSPAKKSAVDELAGRRKARRKPVRDGSKASG